MKIIVAHPGRQHSFRVAKALNQAGLLFKYSTTVYDKKNSLVMKLVKLFLNKDNYSRASKRRCPSLEDNQVIQFCSLEGLLLLLLLRIDPRKYLYNKVARHMTRRFQRKLAKYIIKNDIDIVISYDTTSSLLFDILADQAPSVIKVLDNAHPNRHFLYKSYHENWESSGIFEPTLTGFLVDPEKAKYYGEEIKKADYHIVASSYSQGAVEYEEIQSDKIYKIPYGVDGNKFVKSERAYSKDSLNVLFIGEVNQRKGINQVLTVAKELYNKGFAFNIVGDGYKSAPELFSQFDKYVNFWGRVSFEDLLEQLKVNHVFIFPTMGEGFGLVLLEAMAAGLPVITTPNGAGYDIVKDGYNGFVVPVGDVDAIKEKLSWLKEHPEELDAMSRNAINTAREFTWDKYEKGIVEAVRQIGKKEKIL